MRHPTRTSRRAAGLPRLLVALVLTALAVSGLALAATDSARYRFQGNKWLSLDLSVGHVRVEAIRFEWPATVMGVKTGYKATLKVVNGSSRQVSAGLGVVLYDGGGKLLGAGTTGTKLGTVDPGDTAEFTVSFNHVTDRLEQAEQFHVVLEVPEK